MAKRTSTKAKRADAGSANTVPRMLRLSPDLDAWLQEKTVNMGADSVQATVRLILTNVRQSEQEKAVA